MLVIEISTIPPEGLNVDETLAAAAVHVEGEESFALDGGQLNCRLERGDDQSVHVRGRLVARLGVSCARCLEPYKFALDQELDLFYLPHHAGEDAADEAEDEVELSDHEMVVAYYRGNRLDLGEMIREQFFLTLPMKRLCREDCGGLCPGCGISRNTASCDCQPEPDARLSVLKTLFDKGSS
jgi:uncharacterized protein